MLVFDRNRFGSKREIDPNGYLRVSACNITKTQVRIYYGKEIPGWKDFNLDPDKIYNVYCPAEELKKALETFNNLPLTREHIEVNVNNVPKDKIVGSLGDSAQFKSPYVQNSIIVYDQKDIDWIMSGRKRELSCGYTYTPVQQSGEYNGLPYDFIMTEIVGNHVALVKEGRAGHDVMVADECPEEMACDGGQGSGNFGHYGRVGEIGGSSHVVDLTNDFEKAPSFQEVKEFINKAIEEGTKYLTGNEDFVIDIPSGQHNKRKILNSNNFQKLNQSGQRRHNKYVMSLAKILRNSKYLGNKENTKKDKKAFVDKYHYFGSSVKIGNEVYDLIIDAEQNVGENEIKPQTVHLYNITENDRRYKGSNLDYNPPIVADSISQDLDNVKTFLESFNFCEEKSPETVSNDALSAEDGIESNRTALNAMKVFDKGTTEGNSIRFKMNGLSLDGDSIVPQVSDESKPNFTENENNNKLLDKGEESMVNDEFKEADHPRDKDGKFTSAGSGSSTGGSGSIEHNGAKIDIKKDGKYADVRIYAPEGKKFKNGDTFYTTEAEADKAEELAKKIIENEFGGEGEKKEESSDLESIYSKALEKDPDDRTRNDFLRARYNDIQDLRKRYEAEKDPEEKKEKKADLEFAENQFRKMYGEGSEKKEQRVDLGSGSPRHIYGQKKDGSIAVALKTTNYPNWNKQEIVKEFDNEEDALNYAEERGEAVKSDYQNRTRNSEKYGIATWVTPKELEHIKKHGRFPDDEETTNDEIPAKAGKPEKAGEEEALNKGEEKMAEEVKEAIAEKVKEAKEEKVVEDACGKGKDAKGAKDEGIDKRKLIDEIGGILKGKLEEELWRTVMKKAEELAYNDSERSADDKKPVKDEAEKDLKGKEKEAFAEGVDFGEKKEKEEPKKLDSEHESEGTKKADEKEEKAEDKKEAKDKCTMDSQIVMDVDAIKAQVREEVMADFKARENARKAVRSVVGDVNVMAFDSAEEIYKFACEKAGMDLNEIVSFKDAFRGLSAAKSTKLALDASPISGSNEECFKGIRIA